MPQTYLSHPGSSARNPGVRARTEQSGPNHSGRSFGQNRPQDDSLKVDEYSSVEGQIDTLKHFRNALNNL